MQAVQAYQSCCTCTHTWNPGPVRKCMYDGYRCFLRAGSRGRQRRVRYDGITYEYRDVEQRPVPRSRDDEFVRATLAAMTRLRQPIVGHRHLPLLCNWPGYSWYRFNTPDMMHGQFHRVRVRVRTHSLHTYTRSLTHFLPTDSLTHTRQIPS